MVLIVITYLAWFTDHLQIRGFTPGRSSIQIRGRHQIFLSVSAALHVLVVFAIRVQHIVPSTPQIYRFCPLKLLSFLATTTCV